MQIQSIQQLQELRFSWPKAKCECCGKRGASSFARAEWGSSESFLTLCAACLLSGAYRKWRGGWFVDKEGHYRRIKYLVSLTHLFTITMRQSETIS
jgi:hypothetical protein